MDILGVLTAELGVKMSQVEAAVKLIDQIPEGSNRFLKR